MKETGIQNSTLVAFLHQNMVGILLIRIVLRMCFSPLKNGMRLSIRSWRSFRSLHSSLHSSLHGWNSHGARSCSLVITAWEDSHEKEITETQMALFFRAKNPWLALIRIR